MHPYSSTPLCFPNGHPHYVVDASGCWLWQGSRFATGYGQYRHSTAHRWYYLHYVGSIPAGMHVHHRCRVRCCVNPEHLELLTEQENLAAAIAVVGLPAPSAPSPAPRSAEDEDAALARRFVRYVDRSGACWLWTGATLPRGYGIFRVAGRNVYAHRWAYEQANGPIPAGLFCLHRCDQPRCVRPDHLFVGTHAQNMADQKHKGRNQHGKHHHSAKLSDDDVRAIRHRAAAGDQQARLAREYGLDAASVWDIIHGYHWRHVDPDPSWLPDGTAVGHARGEHHGRARLTDEQVQTIRRRYAAGDVSQAALAAEYGVSQTMIGLIVRRKRWAHLD